MKSIENNTEFFEDEPLRPALTTEAREIELSALAHDAIEERIRNGNASAQELLYFAKVGSTKERLERKILETQNELMQAKREALEAQQRVEELYANAIKAMSVYQGRDSDEDIYNEDL